SAVKRGEHRFGSDRLCHRSVPAAVPAVVLGGVTCTTRIRADPAVASRLRECIALHSLGGATLARITGAYEHARGRERGKAQPQEPAVDSTRHLSDCRQCEAAGRSVVERKMPARTKP